MSDMSDITMEDVETAIKVLTEFVRRSRQATYILKRVEMEFRQTGGRMPQSFEDFVNLAFQTQKAKQMEEPETKAQPLTQEEIDRMREIRDKARRQRAPSQT